MGFLSKHIIETQRLGLEFFDFLKKKDEGIDKLMRRKFKLNMLYSLNFSSNSSSPFTR